MSNNVYKALKKFQSQVPKLVNGAENSHFKNKYMKIDALIDETKDLLHECGLLINHVFGTEHGKSIIFTELIHDSGEKITSYLPLPDIKDPQKIGSAITYYRRYSYAAILGIATENDDDGNSTTPPTDDQVNEFLKLSKQITGKEVTQRTIDYACDLSRSEIRKAINELKRKIK